MYYYEPSKEEDDLDLDKANKMLMEVFDGHLKECALCWWYFKEFSKSPEVLPDAHSDKRSSRGDDFAGGIGIPD